MCIIIVHGAVIIRARVLVYARAHYRIIYYYGGSINGFRAGVYLHVIITIITHTLAVKTVADVSWKTRAREAAQRVGAVGEHVARPVLALVLVCKKNNNENRKQYYNDIVIILLYCSDTDNATTAVSAERRLTSAGDTFPRSAKSPARLPAVAVVLRGIRPSYHKRIVMV